MKDIDLVKLKELAVKAGGDEWHNNLDEVVTAEYIVDEVKFVDHVCNCEVVGTGSPKADFISGANPAVVLALIEQLEAVQRERDSLLASQEHEDDCLINALASRDEWRLRAMTAEAELKRRDAQEPYGYVAESPCSSGYGGMMHEFSIDRSDVETDAAEHEGFVIPLYAAAPAVVLPPEMPERVRDLDNPDDCDHDYLPPAVVYQDGVIDGFNRAIKQAKSLGCQPEKVVRLPESWAWWIASGQVLVMDEDEVKQALDEAGVKWEESK